MCSYTCTCGPGRRPHSWIRLLNFLPIALRISPKPLPPYELFSFSCNVRTYETAPKSSLVKAWNKLFPPPHFSHPTNNSLEDETPSNETNVQLFNDLGYQEGQSWQVADTWIADDTNDPRYQLKTDSKTVTDILIGPENQDSNSDDDTEIQPLVTDADACNAFQTGIKWLEAQNDRSIYSFTHQKVGRHCYSKNPTQTQSCIFFWGIHVMYMYSEITIHLQLLFVIGLSYSSVKHICEPVCNCILNSNHTCSECVKCMYLI